MQAIERCRLPQPSLSWRWFPPPATAAGFTGRMDVTWLAGGPYRLVHLRLDLPPGHHCGPPL